MAQASVGVDVALVGDDDARHDREHVVAVVRGDDRVAREQPPLEQLRLGEVQVRLRGGRVGEGQECRQRREQDHERERADQVLGVVHQHQPGQQDRGDHQADDQRLALAVHLGEESGNTPSSAAAQRNPSLEHDPAVERPESRDHRHQREHLRPRSPRT